MSYIINRMAPCPMTFSDPYLDFKVSYYRPGCPRRIVCDS